MSYASDGYSNVFLCDLTQKMLTCSDCNQKSLMELITLQYSQCQQVSRKANALLEVVSDSPPALDLSSVNTEYALPVVTTEELFFKIILFVLRGFVPSLLSYLSSTLPVVTTTEYSIQSFALTVVRFASLLSDRNSNQPQPLVDNLSRLHRRRDSHELHVVR